MTFFNAVKSMQATLTEMTEAYDELGRIADSRKSIIEAKDVEIARLKAELKMFVDWEYEIMWPMRKAPKEIADTVHHAIQSSAATLGGKTLDQTERQRAFHAWWESAE